MKRLSFDRALRIGVLIGLAAIAVYLVYHACAYGFHYVIDYTNS
jgi:uncharacterized membrane protein (GlpM family)